MKAIVIRSAEAQPRRPFGGFESTHELGRRIRIDGRLLGKHVLVSYGVENLVDETGTVTGQQIHALRVVPAGPVIALKSQELLGEKEAVDMGLERIARGSLPEDSAELLQEGYENFNRVQARTEAFLLKTLRQFTQEP